MEKKQKVFVRGMKDYGSAVIQSLERLGGINANGFTGTKSENIYFIRHNRIIECALADTETAHIIMEEYELLHPQVIRNGTIMVRPADAEHSETSYAVVCGTAYGVMKDSGNKEFLGYSLYLQVNGSTLDDYTKDNRYICYLDGYFPVNDAWEAQFHDTLHTIGKEWDAEKKELVDYNARWKPSDRTEYYYVTASGDADKDVWRDWNIDEERHAIGNCFRTEEAAKRAADAFRELLKNNIFDNDDDDDDDDE